MKSALSRHGIFSTCPAGQYTRITCHARRRHEITCVMEPMSPTETHLFPNVTLASTTETIVENGSVTMKQNVTRVAGQRT